MAERNEKRHIYSLTIICTISFWMYDAVIRKRKQGAQHRAHNRITLECKRLSLWPISLMSKTAHMGYHQPELHTVFGRGTTAGSGCKLSVGQRNFCELSNKSRWNSYAQPDCTSFWSAVSLKAPSLYRFVVNRDWGAISWVQTMLLGGNWKDLQMG